MRFAEQCWKVFQWEHVQVHFVLNQHAELDFIVLAHWNNNLRVYMSLNSDTLFWSEQCWKVLYIQSYLVMSISDTPRVIEIVGSSQIKEY
jgi:hypothetical protein